MAGLAPALLAGVGFAVFQTVNRRALTRVDVYRGTAALLAAGAVVLLLVAVATDGLALVRGATTASLLAFGAAGAIHFSLGWTLLGMSQVRLGAAGAGVVIGAVPLFGAVVAHLFLDEPLSPVAVGGLVVGVIGVCVVAARGGVTVDHRRVVPGVLAGLGTAMCWAVSPLLIRAGLVGLPSPLVGASLGMAASAVVYAAAVAAWRRTPDRALEGRAGVDGATRVRLALAGTAVSLAIWMQWTAFDRWPVASVLAVLQVTPLLVVLLAVRVGGDRLTPQGQRRAWVGAGLIVSGSLVLLTAG